MSATFFRDWKFCMRVSMRSQLGAFSTTVKSEGSKRTRRCCSPEKTPPQKTHALVYYLIIYYSLFLLTHVRSMRIQTFIGGLCLYGITEMPGIVVLSLFYAV